MGATELFSAAFIGGSGPAPERCRLLCEGARTIAAADSGLLRTESAGLFPQLIAGDMDSLAAAGEAHRLERYPPSSVFRYDTAKDFSDTEIVLRLLWERGERRVKLIGGGGGRTDHLFAIRALFEQDIYPVSWHTETEDIYAVDTAVQLNVQPGALISVFSAGHPPWKLESKGLRWPLDSVNWSRGAFSLSNTSPSGECFLNPVAGRFLLIVNVVQAAMDGRRLCDGRLPF